MAFSSIRTSAGFEVTRDIRNAPKWASVKGSCSEIRDGPVEKLWGGRGIFELQEFFFLIKFLV